MNKLNQQKIKQHLEKSNVIPFANCFSYISPRDLEEILEWLNDNKYLSDRGIIFRSRFWELFIKKSN